MFKTEKRPQKYLNIFYVLMPLLIYDAIILFKYLNSGKFTNAYISILPLFTYQNSGFISRGLVPSILEYLEINNKYTYLIIYNIVILLYSFLIVYISGLYNAKFRNLYIITFLFFFFGIPHFGLDTFRADSIILLNTLIVFILLHRHNYLSVFIISILSLLIHEAALFLLIPIIFLLVPGNKKWIFSILLFAIFLSIILLSNKMSEHQVIEILEKGGVENIEYWQYAGNILGGKEAITFYFKMYNVSMFILYGIIYLIVLFFSFRELFTIKILEFRWLFLMPLALCFVAVDYPRWYCFVYFLAMLYALHFQIFTKKAFYQIFLVTIILGIPLAMYNKLGVIPILFHFLK